MKYINNKNQSGRAVLYRPNIWIAGSNPTRAIDVYLRFYVRVDLCR
jgi:hypothetical protein